ncbi:MAG: hypothetical protein K8Q99_00910 [Acholeplasmataceae bacterium]|nr:hypothetical protein [Acholeplasmataceae bacterium]
MKILNYILTVLGLLILIIISIMSINDAQAVDLVSAIPASILGAALFISGYIGMALENKK